MDQTPAMAFFYLNYGIYDMGFMVLYYICLNYGIYATLLYLPKLWDLCYSTIFIYLNYGIYDTLLYLGHAEVCPSAE